MKLFSLFLLFYVFVYKVVIMKFLFPDDVYDTSIYIYIYISIQQITKSMELTRICNLSQSVVLYSQCSVQTPLFNYNE